MEGFRLSQKQGGLFFALLVQNIAPAASKRHVFEAQKTRNSPAYELSSRQLSPITHKHSRL